MHIYGLCSGEEAENKHAAHVETLRIKLEAQYARIQTEVGYSGKGFSGKVGIVGIYEKTADDKPESIDVKSSENMANKGKLGLSLVRLEMALKTKVIWSKNQLPILQTWEISTNLTKKEILLKSTRFK